MFQVQKWGNSLGIRIPKAVAVKAGLEEGFDVEQNKIIIKRKEKKLDELLLKITPDNIHGEISAGDPEGREAW